MLLFLKQSGSPGGFSNDFWPKQWHGYIIGKAVEGFASISSVVVPLNRCKLRTSKGDVTKRQSGRVLGWETGHKTRGFLYPHLEYRLKFTLKL